MTVNYREYIQAVARSIDADADIARVAAKTTLAVLGGELGAEDRARLRGVLPAELREDLGDEPAHADPAPDARSFVEQVSLLGRWPPEVARLRAQAVLGALGEHEPRLVAELDVPAELRELFAAPHAGGGVTDPAGHEPPLTEDEVVAALETLPEWTGDTRALRRTISLPPGNLDGVLDRIRRLHEEVGRGPAIRRGADSAELELYTSAVEAVTALDVELAARIDDVIAEAGAGIASP